MKRSFMAGVALASVVGAAGASQAAVIVAPVSVSVTSGGTVGSFWTVDNVIDQSGLVLGYTAACEAPAAPTTEARATPAMKLRFIPISVACLVRRASVAVQVCAIATRRKWSGMRRARGNSTRVPGDPCAGRAAM